MSLLQIPSAGTGFANSSMAAFGTSELLEAFQENPERGILRVPATLRTEERLDSSVTSKVSITRQLLTSQIKGHQRAPLAETVRDCVLEARALVKSHHFPDRDDIHGRLRHEKDVQNGKPFFLAPAGLGSVSLGATANPGVPARWSIRSFTKETAEDYPHYSVLFSGPHGKQVGMSALIRLAKEDGRTVAKEALDIGLAIGFSNPDLAFFHVNHFGNQRPNTTSSSYFFDFSDVASAGTLLGIETDSELGFTIGLMKLALNQYYSFDIGPVTLDQVTEEEIYEKHSTLYAKRIDLNSALSEIEVPHRGGPISLTAWNRKYERLANVTVYTDPHTGKRKALLQIQTGSSTPKNPAMKENLGMKENLQKSLYAPVIRSIISTV